MSGDNPYKVRLNELPARRELSLEPTFVAEAIATHPMRQALERPAGDPQAGTAEVAVDLYGDEDNVFVRGRLRGWLAVACSRCLGEVRIDIDEPLAVTFLPKERIPDEDEDAEVEVTEDDEDLYPYEGEEVNLEPLLREQLVLSVPFAPVCAEDCKGLCPHCGADLNVHPCQCERTSIDPRLAALKDLKLS